MNNLSNVGRLIKLSGFEKVLESSRLYNHFPCEPWVKKCIDVGDENYAKALFNILHGHIGNYVKNISMVGDLLKHVSESELFSRSASGEIKLKWQVTSHRGLLAVRDVPLDENSDSKVYIGEDSLRFVDWILSANKRGVGLDIGAGSGISSVALAKSCDTVLAVDVDADCCKAIPVTSELNGLQMKVQTRQIDITENWVTNEQFDVVIANTPGAPIPSTITYSPAGCGGEDGLVISGAILKKLPELLSSSGSALIKFESIGDEQGPFAKNIVRKLAIDNNWRVNFYVYCVIPIEVRNAISSRWAAPLNRNIDANNLLSTFDAHTDAIGATQFYTCAVEIIKSDYFELNHLELGPRPVIRLDEMVSVNKSVMGEKERYQIVAKYLERLNTIPDGLRELDLANYLHLPIEKLEDLMVSFSEIKCFKDVIHSVFKSHFERDSIGARSLYVLTAIILEALR